MNKSNSNFGAGCPNWADWADLRFGFVHSTGIIEQYKSVYHNQDTSTHIWWIGIENLLLKHHLILNYLPAFLESFSTGLGKLSGRAPTESTLSSDNGSPARSGVLQIIRLIINNSSNNNDNIIIIIIET